MVLPAHPSTARQATTARPELRLVEERRRRAELHLFTYIVGNALFWTLWGAVAISADRWYLWPIVPFVGWTLVLGFHLWHVYRSES